MGADPNRRDRGPFALALGDARSVGGNVWGKGSVEETRLREKAQVRLAPVGEVGGASAGASQAIKVRSGRTAPKKRGNGERAERPCVGTRLTASRRGDRVWKGASWRDRTGREWRALARDCAAALGRFWGVAVGNPASFPPPLPACARQSDESRRPSERHRVESVEAGVAAASQRRGRVVGVGGGAQQTSAPVGVVTGWGRIECHRRGG